MSHKLTDKIVRTLQPPTCSNRITYDSEVAGFGVRVTAGGAVAFVLNYRRKADGLERRYTIGAFPDWSVAAARERAKELKRHIDSGGRSCCAGTGNPAEAAGLVLSARCGQGAHHRQ